MVRSGYASTLQCAGPFDDPSATGAAQLASFITAIDAMDFRRARDGGSARAQLLPASMERELRKAFAGFVLPPDALGGCQLPDALATGNWGAGAFRGDAALKALEQWAAASEAGLASVHYYVSHGTHGSVLCAPCSVARPGRSVRGDVRICAHLCVCASRGGDGGGLRCALNAALRR